jgi:preprotein translocase subunit SecD
MTDMSRRTLSQALVLALGSQILPSIPMAQAQTLPQPKPTNSDEVVGIRVILVREVTTQSGATGLQLTFDAPSAVRFREFSRQVVGRRVAMYRDDRKLAAYVMRTLVTGDGVEMTGAVDAESRSKLLVGAPLTFDFRVE